MSMPLEYNVLLKFLEDHEGQQVWLLIPPGVVSGTLPNIPKDLPKNRSWQVQISDASFYTGTRSLFLGQVIIGSDQIYACGMGAPEFIKE